ncbi:hypothetical protein SFUMM280S_03559 [Streptomyces fumanus]
MPAGKRAVTWKSSVPASGQRASRPSPSSPGGKRCQFSRSRPVIRTSATSEGPGSTARPVTGTPTARRTAERPPSAATAYRARSALPSAQRTRTSASSWSRPTTSRPKRIRPPSSSSLARNIRWVRHCGTIHGSVYGACSVGSIGSHRACSPSRSPSRQIIPTG